MSFFYSESYQGVPQNVNLNFPWERIGLPQLDDYQVTSPQFFTQLAVMDGPDRRRFDRSSELFNFKVSFTCSKIEANAFEGFYFDTIDQGMLWFKMPLSTGDGIRLCTVRELPNNQYVMTRIGTHYRYDWSLEGYRGTVIDDQFVPPVVPQPDEPIPDFYDGGSAGVEHPDRIDALGAGDNITDFISGGNAES